MSKFEVVAVSKDVSLLETMRLENGEICRSERHLQRMRRSAAAFRYSWNDENVRGRLNAAGRDHPAGVWRLRLMLNSKGNPSVACVPYVEGLSRPWQLAFARRPVNANEPLLRHKTTSRVFYDSVRCDWPEMEDVLLWNHAGHVTESTIANIVVEIEGVRLTPDLRCGLLPGVAREELVERGEIVERVLSKADVRQASRLWLVNSLRGWVEGRLFSEGLV